MPSRDGPVQATDLFTRSAAHPTGTDRGRALIQHMRGRGTRRLTTDQILAVTRGARG